MHYCQWNYSFCFAKISHDTLIEPGTLLIHNIYTNFIEYWHKIPGKFKEYTDSSWDFTHSIT